MKLSIERSALLKALAHVQSVVERRNTIPILSNVRLEAGENGLGLQATDMDLEIRETVPARVSEEGLTTAPAHMLYDIVRRLPEGAEISLSRNEEDGCLTLSAGRSRFSLATLPVEDFPVMSEGDLPVSFELSGKDLRTLIDRTRFAVSTEETRYYLNGIFLHVNSRDGKDVLRAAATDGHRLACMELSLPDGAAGMPSIILPRKTITELRKLIEDVEDGIRLDVSESKVRLSFNDVVLASKLIDGTYPDYERVIPQANDRVLTVETALFSDAIDRVSVISEKSRGVRLALDKNSVTLSASSAESGSAEEAVEAEYASDPMEVGFNSRYLLDILQQIETDRVGLAMADSASPMMVDDVENTGTLYVLMPMRV